MSTESERPAETPDKGGAKEPTEKKSEISLREQIEFNREIKTVEQEGEYLTACQKFLRLKRGCDEDAVDNLHRKLIEFLQARSKEKDDVGLSEVAVALWDELVRIEMGLREGGNSESGANNGSAVSTRSETSQSNTHRTALKDDPMFQ
jgi:hypothetical protein